MRVDVTLVLVKMEEHVMTLEKVDTNVFAIHLRAKTVKLVSDGGVIVEYDGADKPIG